MKLIQIATPICIALLGSLATFEAEAVDGTITINGQVTDASCTVKALEGFTAVGAPNASPTVALPKISTNQLPIVTATTGDTPFTIDSNCTSAGTTPTIAHVSTYFDPTSVGVNSAGRLTPTGTGAAGWDIQITDVNHNVINLYAGSGSQNVPVVNLVTPVPSDTQQTFFARYYRTGAITPGAATAGLGFVQVYQ